MKIILSLLSVFLFGFGVFAQTTEVKFYQGEDYMPYIFEPYQADYGINAKFLGADLNLFKYNVKIVELQDRWVETQSWQIPAPANNRVDVLSMTTQIDLKTGLPIKALIEFEGLLEDEGYIINKSEISYLDGKYAISSVSTNEKGKVKARGNFAIDVKEKIYSCQSVTFFSYLPLGDNFAGSYTCLISDFGDSGQGDTHRITKQTIRVVGSEKIATKAGIFDCYKIEQVTEELGYYDQKGIFHSPKKNKAPKNFDENKFFNGFSGGVWIDKKTRKMIKGGLHYKDFAGLEIEMMPVRSKPL